MDLLVGTTLALIVGVGTVMFVRAQSVATRTQMAQTDMNDEARSVIQFMVRELSLTGYYPRCAAGAQWATVQTTTGIIAAGPQTLRVQYDLNENGAIETAAAASEDVTYQYDAATATVQRVVGGVASALSGDVPSTGFELKYYNCSPGSEIVGTGAGGALTAAQMLSVCRISIKLELAKGADTRTTNQVRSSLWTNVLLRNRQNACA
jgi:Tfp pilus assembly protein PilW